MGRIGFAEEIAALAVYLGQMKATSLPAMLMLLMAAGQIN